MPSPATTRRSKLDFAARALQPTQVRTGFFPVSGSSARAVIASQSTASPRARYQARYGYRFSPSSRKTRHRGTSPKSLRRKTAGYASVEAPAALAASVVAARGAGAEAPTAPSERMSIRQPVRRAASRAFCPSLPMASESW
jgi:hypothetical protein